MQRIAEHPAARKAVLQMQRVDPMHDHQPRRRQASRQVGPENLSKPDMNRPGFVGGSNS
jgi:hypothetical protein